MTETPPIPQPEAPAESKPPEPAAAVTAGDGAEAAVPVADIAPEGPVEAATEAEQAESAVGVVVAEAEEAHEAEGAGQPEPAEPVAAADVPARQPPQPAQPTLSPAACAALLAEHFPALFGAGRALPIKLRIQADIQARAPGLVNKKSLSIFFHRYTTSTAYLKALATQPQRLDLDGAPAGEIADEHKQAAAAEVERRRSLFEDRRAIEREAQRAAADKARRDHAAQQAARQAAHDNADAEGRRNRATLLRAFETTTLTATNFCALKGLAEADLQAQLLLARQEREQRPPEPPPRPQRPPQQRPAQRDHRGGGGGRPGSGGRGKPGAKPAR